MTVIAFPKSSPVRSEPYRRLVASMPCMICCRVGWSQAAHMNGGGGATKRDDRYTFPACADAPGVKGCHMRHDQPGQEAVSKDVRRRREARLVLDTLHEAIESGRWPPKVPRLTREQMAELERWAA